MKYVMDTWLVPQRGSSSPLAPYKGTSSSLLLRDIGAQQEPWRRWQRSSSRPLTVGRLPAGSAVPFQVDLLEPLTLFSPCFDLYWRLLSSAMLAQIKTMTLFPRRSLLDGCHDFRSPFHDRCCFFDGVDQDQRSRHDHRPPSIPKP